MLTEEEMFPEKARHRELVGLLAEIRDALVASTGKRLTSPQTGLRASESDAGPSKGSPEDPPTRERPSGGDSDLTEEPEVGTTVVDRDGDVWKRHAEGWAFWKECEGWTGYFDPWPVVREYAPLRLATPDDLGITEPSEGGSEPAADDDDGDEVLARVIWESFGGAMQPKWETQVGSTRQWYLKAARAAREHLAAERAARPWDAAEKGLTLAALGDALEGERDWRAKHEALRADVERHRGQCAENADDTTASYGYRGRCAHTEDTLKVILRSDAARDPSGDHHEVGSKCQRDHCEETHVPDADTVTLRRDDVEVVLDHYRHLRNDKARATQHRVRAALGWEQ